MGNIFTFAIIAFSGLLGSMDFDHVRNHSLIFYIFLYPW